MEIVQVLIDSKEYKGSRFSLQDQRDIIGVINEKKKISSFLKKLGGRGLNLSEVLTEGLLCSLYDFVRVNKSGSFDCFDEKTGQKIEVKSTQLVKNDLTSFSPKAFTWDILYFMDFAHPGKLFLYTFTKEEISRAQVSSTQTVADQQREKRRPRLSLKKLIELNHKSPVYECKLI